VERCERSVTVQTKFMEGVIVQGGLRYFLGERVSYEGIERMLNAVWENCTFNDEPDGERERTARENLTKLVADLRVS
jgi:hypothetical protein